MMKWDETTIVACSDVWMLILYLYSTMFLFVDVWYIYLYIYLYTSTLRGYTAKHPGKRGDYKAPVVHAGNASKNICVNHDSMTMNLRCEAFKANPNLGENDTEMTRFWLWCWARHLLNGAPNRHPFPDTHQKGCLMDTRSPTHLQGVEKTDT